MNADKDTNQQTRQKIVDDILQASVRFPIGGGPDRGHVILRPDSHAVTFLFKPRQLVDAAVCCVQLWRPDGQTVMLSRGSGLEVDNDRGAPKAAAITIAEDNDVQTWVTFTGLDDPYYMYELWLEEADGSGDRASHSEVPFEIWV